MIDKIREAKKELRDLFLSFSAIEAKYPDHNITNKEDERKIGRLLNEIDKLEGEISAMRDGAKDD